MELEETKKLLHYLFEFDLLSICSSYWNLNVKPATLQFLKISSQFYCLVFLAAGQFDFINVNLFWLPTLVRLKSSPAWCLKSQSRP